MEYAKEQEKIIETKESLTININSHLPDNGSSGTTPLHNGKGVDQIIVSQDMSYAVTRSIKDNSILGWLINIEKDGQQQPDVYFKHDQHDISSFVLYKKILVFHH